MTYDPDFEVGSDLERALSQIGSEVRYAQRKHPPINSIHEAYAVMLEELDEFWDACREQVPNVTQARHEAIQVAAMAVRTILDVAHLDVPSVS